ncbi:MAG: hypothetical protein ICV66_05625 [Chitinophagaceae bacterium]|nr:hypothetical protein [Chitinophagaceae bacterium]
MDQRTGMHKIDMDVENLPNSRNTTGVSQRFSNSDSKNSSRDAGSNDEFADIGPRTETESLKSLGSKNAEIGIPQNADNDDLKTVSGTDSNDKDLDVTRGGDADVTREERMALENVSMPTRDEDNLRRAALDNTDFDGEELNEDSFGKVLSSADLDIPDETDDTTTTAMGQGDEENKYYSLGGDRHERDEEDPYSGPLRGNDT